MADGNGACAKLNDAIRQTTCRSEDSEHYPDFDIEHDDIVRLFIVKGWFCRDSL